MLDFNVRAQDYFRRWYIDGRIFFHKVIDTEKPKDGIKDVRYVDPRKIRKVREVKKEKDKKSQITLIKDVQEYFVFDEKGIATNSQMSYRTDVVNDKAIKVSKDAVTYCTSGLVDQDRNIPLILSSQAIRPANQLRMMENAVVIYRITRAPRKKNFLYRCWESAHRKSRTISKRCDESLQKQTCL